MKASMLMELDGRALKVQFYVWNLACLMFLGVVGQLSIGVLELGNFMHTNSRIIDSVYESHYGCLIDGFLGLI